MTNFSHRWAVWLEVRFTSTRISTKKLMARGFLNDLKNNLSRPVVFDAIMRVRTSTGVRPCDFYGSFYMANTTDTELASLNADMAIACKSFFLIFSPINWKVIANFIPNLCSPLPGEIKYDDKLTEEDGVYVQVALLFTSCSGQRRLRIINLSLNTGTAMADMYRNCKSDFILLKKKASVIWTFFPQVNWIR